MKKVLLLILGIFLFFVLTENVLAAPLEHYTTMRMEDAVEVLGRDGAKYQGRMIMIESYGKANEIATTVRENALIRATWEVNRLGFERFVIIFEENFASQTTTTGTSNRFSAGGITYNISVPAQAFTQNTIVMIVLCILPEEIEQLSGDTQIFSVSTRLAKAQQIAEKEKAPGLYWDFGIGLGGGSVTFGNGIDSSSFFAMPFDFKIGYGPFGHIPLYAVGDISFDFALGDVTDIPIFLGVGALFYPVKFIQIGLSLGVSLPLIFDLSTYTPGYYSPSVEAEAGFSWKISAAYDLDIKSRAWPPNGGVLFGIQLSGASYDYKYRQLGRRSNPTIEESGTMSKVSFTVFSKMTFRRRVQN